MGIKQRKAFMLVSTSNEELQCKTSTVGSAAVDFSVYLVVTCLEGKVSRGKRVAN
jgi:hypothetical protein